MNPWNTYVARGNLHGQTPRDRAKNNLMNRLTNQIPSTLSYHNVDIDGEERNIVIINSDNLNQKTLCSLPGEDIRHGAMIDWNNYQWLVTERDANTEIYTKCIMEQCNYLLRWVDPDTREVMEYWCIIEDGTKLKRRKVRNSLAYWKRYVKTTPLIAGNPLEPSHQNGIANSYKRQWSEDEMDWAISSEISNRDTFIDYPEDRSRGKRLQTGSPKPHCGMVKI